MWQKPSPPLPTSRARCCLNGQVIYEMKGITRYLPFLLDELNILNNRQEVEDKKTFVTLFLARFILDEAEVEALSWRDIPIDQRFFDAMDKTTYKRRLSCSYGRGGWIN